MKKILLAALKSSSGTLVALLSTAVAIKIIATIAGTAGVGLFSLLRQIQQTASIASTIGGQVAIVHGLSNKYGKEKDAHIALIFQIIVIATAITCVVIILAAPWIASFIFVNLQGGENIIRLLALPIVLGSALIFLSGIITSYRAVGILAVVQICSGLSLAAFAYPVSIYPTGINFIYLLSVSSLVGVIVAIYFCIYNGWFSVLETIYCCYNGKYKDATFYKMGAATFITGMISSGTVLIVRTLVNRYYGLESAGIFDAAWTISMTYVTLILTSLSAYYLPTLTMLTGKNYERNELIRQYFNFTTFASIPLIGSVIVLKPWIIQLLYSNEFSKAEQIMQWLLIGDFFKISSWVLAMPMLAYMDIRPYIISEFMWNFLFICSTATIMYANGSVKKIGFVYCILYMLYFFYMCFYCFKKFQFLIDRNMLFVWIVGLIVLVSISFSGLHSGIN